MRRAGMKCLRSFDGVSRMDRVRNEEMRRRAGIKRELASRADPRCKCNLLGFYIISLVYNAFLKHF